MIFLLIIWQMMKMRCKSIEAICEIRIHVERKRRWRVHKVISWGIVDGWVVPVGRVYAEFVQWWNIFEFLLVSSVSKNICVLIWIFLLSHLNHYILLHSIFCIHSLDFLFILSFAVNILCFLDLFYLHLFLDAYLLAYWETLGRLVYLLLWTIFHAFQKLNYQLLFFFYHRSQLFLLHDQGIKPVFHLVFCSAQMSGVFRPFFPRFLNPCQNI